MAFFDVFNGDADGIIALLQLRLHTPRKSQLITGVKRDIKLLARVDAAPGDQVTVLDISMEKNSSALQQLLDAGVQVSYFDHHRAGDIPDSEALRATIDMDPEVCTSLLIDRHLDGQYRDWAIAGAYGDNLTATADALAAEHGLDSEQAALLRELGVLLNYNGYGASQADLHIAPAMLFKQLVAYRSPFDLIKEEGSLFHHLRSAYAEDMSKVEELAPVFADDSVALYRLPNEPWARRVSGTFGNLLANAHPDRAHAVLTENSDATYTVSIRAPLTNKVGADEICTQFPTGGGRKGAAGINQLAKEDVERLLELLCRRYGAQ